MNFSVKTDILSYIDVEKENFPKGWTKCTLDEIAYINDVNHKMPKSVERGIPFVSPKDFTESGIDFNNVKQISKKDFEILSKKVKPCEGDILFSRIGTIGKARLAPNKEFGISYSLAVVRSRTSDIFNKYLLYLMGSHSVYLQSHRKKNGIGVPDLGLNEIRNFIIPLPPLPEQKLIVAKIESIFTQIDAAQKNLEVLASQVKSSSSSLNALKSSVLKQAFEGKLVPQDSNDEPAEILLKKIQKDSKKELIFEKENLPNGWVWGKIEDITHVLRGASPRPKGDPRFFGGNIPWIMISDVSRVKGKYLEKTRDSVTVEGAKRSRLLQKGSLILSNSGSVCLPKILLVNGCIHDGFLTFPDIPDNMNINYMYYWFEYIRPKIIQENKQGVTQINLNINIVKNIYILIPPLNEQQRIIAKIESIFDRIDAICLIHVFLIFVMIYFIQTMMQFFKHRILNSLFL